VLLEYAVSISVFIYVLLIVYSLRYIFNSINDVTALKFNTGFSRDLDSWKLITGRRSFTSYLGNPRCCFLTVLTVAPFKHALAYTISRNRPRELRLRRRE